ncbi:30S ribosomal protein S6 [Alkalibaculum sp. M08DMB]|uniref:Small ribosomal subunit protein bS6 n=1 Tax=Alkalibaculum sporogenes TaxID=2655001 RepID=A0A6A7K778_9FIRM|nr:30S ribosomal protein S6 [Alkalibaculum sporogenes]MPW25300.1 30S ribosomal protein S6 [Alkalibaculum sporogenes]
MRKYETMFILNPELAIDTVKEIVEKIKAIIEKSGEIESVEEWGKKKLAYTINNKYTEGYYVLMYFNANNEVLIDLEHEFKVNEGFIRHMILSKED